MTDLIHSPHDTVRTVHILVVEDDPFVRDVLELYLHNEGYQVTLAGDGRKMREVLSRQPVHLLIMDVRLPGEDGFALTRYVRAHHHVGIIILTTRHETVDRVVGLECGADDYVTKPFEERELLARIRSVLRRTGVLVHDEGTAAAPTGDRSQYLFFHDGTLDEKLGVFCGRDRTETMLTTNECRLLAYLARHAGRAQSRETLTTAVLHRRWTPLDRSIDVLITRLRRKIEADPKRPTIIKTIRGIGYVVMSEAAVLSSTAA